MASTSRSISDSMAAVTLPGSSGSRSTTICSTGRPPMPPRALISDTARAEPPIISCPSAATWPPCGKAEPIRYGRRGSARRWAGDDARAWPFTTACTRPTGSARNAPPPSGGGSRSRPSSTASAATPARVDCPSLARIRSACLPTVRPPEPSSAPISLFESPPTISVTTSSSRTVSP